MDVSSGNNKDPVSSALEDAVGQVFIKGLIDVSSPTEDFERLPVLRVDRYMVND